MTERRIQQSSQKCILFRGHSGHLLYSTFETDLDSENAQMSMIKQGFMVIGAMFVPDAKRLIQIETRMNINPSEIPRR